MIDHEACVSDIIFVRLTGYIHFLKLRPNRKIILKNDYLIQPYKFYFQIFYKL